MTTKSTTAAIRFALIFAAHKTELIFNAAPDARFATIGGNGTSWKAAQFLNAIGNRINVAKPSFAVTGEGIYLHTAIEDVVALGMPNDNVGAVTSTGLATLIQEGKVTYSKDIEAGHIYRIRFDGVAVFASKITILEWTEDQPDFADHNQNTYALVKNLEILRSAEKNGINIRLIYTEKQAPRFELMKAQWDLFLAGKFDELAAMIQDGIRKAQERRAVRAGGRAAANGLEMPETAKNSTGEAVKLADQVGKEIQFLAKDVKRGWVVLPTVHSVTAENAGPLAFAMKMKGYRFTVVGETMEVTEVVYTSKAPKARKATKKVAA